MTKEEMIHALVDFSLAAAADNPRESWLRDLFTRGFRGFENMSPAELMRELQFRGIVPFEESVEDDDLNDDGEDFAIEDLPGRARSRSFAETDRD